MEQIVSRNSKRHFFVYCGAMVEQQKKSCASARLFHCGSDLPLLSVRSHAIMFKKTIKTIAALSFASANAMWSFLIEMI
jgi:hypothetical protein